MPSSDSSKKIILETSLQGFFFEGLINLNKKSLCPVPESALYYSSEVLDKFILSKDFFDISDGKVREKILGMKLLEATQLPREERKKVLKEVGDMSLLICGYFYDSTSKKLVDAQYYAQLGKMAYSQLNTVYPNFLDIPRFYDMFATCFEPVTTLISLLASKEKMSEENHLIFKKILKDEPVTDQEMLLAGVMVNPSKKVS